MEEEVEHQRMRGWCVGGSNSSVANTWKHLKTFTAYKSAALLWAVLPNQKDYWWIIHSSCLRRWWAVHMGHVLHTSRIWSHSLTFISFSTCGNTFFHAVIKRTTNRRRHTYTCCAHSWGMCGQRCSEWTAAYKVGYSKAASKRPKKLALLLRNKLSQ